jgi:hypothetical protein
VQVIVLVQRCLSEPVDASIRSIAQHMLQRWKWQLAGHMQVGGKLRWDPERERFPDDNAANARLTRPQRDWRRAYGG